MEMKLLFSHQVKFQQIAFVLLMLLSFTSCSSEKENDEPYQGTWAAMRWKQTEGGQPEKEGGHEFVVPSSGDTYKFTCLNYSVEIANVWVDDVTYYANRITNNYDLWHLSGEAFEVESFYREPYGELTITINENTTGSERKIRVNVWHLDIHDAFYFTQKAK